MAVMGRGNAAFQDVASCVCVDSSCLQNSQLDVLI